VIPDGFPSKIPSVVPADPASDRLMPDGLDPKIAAVVPAHSVSGQPIPDGSLPRLLPAAPAAVADPGGGAGWNPAGGTSSKQQRRPVTRANLGAGPCRVSGGVRPTPAIYGWLWQIRVQLQARWHSAAPPGARQAEPEPVAPACGCWLTRISPRCGGS